MNARTWLEGVKREGALIVAATHLVAIILGVVTGLGWLDSGVAALFVGFAAVVAAVLVLIRKPVSDLPSLTLSIMILTVVTPAAAGILAYGVVDEIVVEDSHAVDVKWSPDLLRPGDTAQTVVRVESGYGRLRVPVSYRDPKKGEGSCPNNRISVLMDDHPPNQEKNDFGNGDVAEFEVREGKSSVTLSMELHASQNCTVNIKTKDVTFHR
jgi:hypothetical protein